MACPPMRRLCLALLVAFFDTVSSALPPLIRGLHWPSSGHPSQSEASNETLACPVEPA